MMQKTVPSNTQELSFQRFFRGSRRLRIALTGAPNTGKTTIFRAVSSISVDKGQLTGSHKPYAATIVGVRQSEALLVDLPGIQRLHHLSSDEQKVCQHLLWGDQRPEVSQHEAEAAPTPFLRPEVLLHVIDASRLEESLSLVFELQELGLPMVIALNRMDEAKRKGIHIDIAALSKDLGLTVQACVANKGQGISELFDQLLEAAQQDHKSQQTSPLSTWKQQIEQCLDQQTQALFQCPASLLSSLIIQQDPWILSELKAHAPHTLAPIQAILQQAESTLTHSLATAHAIEREHRAAQCFQQYCRQEHQSGHINLTDSLDTLFLHRYWGLLSSIAVFSFVLFIVLEVSSGLDSISAAPLGALLAQWQPEALWSIMLYAVADAFIGLIGIVIPYMIPLVLLLVAMEESGIMQRIAFVVDRMFHHLGLHGQVALPFLLGLGCNVPALTAIRHSSSGHERIIASLLITFIPCSARSAIILAVVGKYIGALGIVAIFALNILIIALLSRILLRRYPQMGSGVIQHVPAYRLPQWRSLLHSTWSRTRDIITIVTPLLILGTLILSLLSYWHAESFINAALAPITHWLLGLPEALGVPILFGVLRKELSLLMIYQALGTQDISQYLDTIQLISMTVFLTFYMPCVSTFATMLRTIGMREACFSALLSFIVALILACMVRLLLTLCQWFIPF